MEDSNPEKLEQPVKVRNLTPGKGDETQVKSVKELMKMRKDGWIIIDEETKQPIKTDEDFDKLAEKAKKWDVLEKSEEGSDKQVTVLKPVSGG